MPRSPGRSPRKNPRSPGRGEAPAASLPPPSGDWTARDLLRAQALPPRKGTWLGARVPLGLQAEDAGKMDLCVWMDATVHAVFAFNLIPTTSPAGELARLLRLALLQPVADVAAFRPTHLAVQPEDEQAALVEVMGRLDMAWDVAPDFLPLDDMVQGFLEQMGGASPPTTGDGVTDGLVSDFRRAVGLLLEAAPWRFTLGEQLIRIHGLLHEPVYVSLEGGEGKETSASFFLGREAVLGPFTARTAEEMRRLPVLLLSFVSPDMCGPSLRREMRSPDWVLPLAEGYPVAVRLDRDPPHHVANQEELRLVTLLLQWMATMPFEQGRPFETSLPLGTDMCLVATWPVSPLVVRDGGETGDRSADPPRRARTGARKSKKEGGGASPRGGRSRARQDDPARPD